MGRRIGAAIAAAAIGTMVLAAPALAGGGAHCPDPLPEIEPSRVLVLDNCFAPGAIEIQTGDTVVWDSQGVGIHTLTFSSLNAGDLGPADTSSVKFNEAGTYNYQCIYHPGMVGAVTVVGSTVAGEPIEPLSEIRYLSGQGSMRFEEAVADPAPASPQQLQSVELRIGLAGGLIIAVALLFVAIASATASTLVAVRLARR